MTNTLLDILFAAIIMLGIGVVSLLIVIVGFAIYWFIWTSLYVPVNKKFKYDEAIIERDKEFNQLKVEHAELIKFTEDQHKIYESYVLKKQDVLDEIKDAEKELKRKQYVAKEHEKEFMVFNQFKESAEGLRFLAKLKKQQEKEGTQ